jgi:cation transport protein ChaC
MALTPEHVAQVHRVLEDPGPDPTWTYHTDEDYDALVQSLLASHPGGPDTWLFAYGSLIWKPELDHVEVRRGTAQGWHRSFCFRIERFRGTKEQPGLMMSLDRGGQCQGVVFRLPPEDLEEQLKKLVRREITVKPPNNIPRWISVETEQGSLHALAFVMNRKSRFYTRFVARIGELVTGIGSHRRPAPFMSDICRAVQSQCRSPAPHFQAAVPGDELGRV